LCIALLRIEIILLMKFQVQKLLYFVRYAPDKTK
jgi:hypothetical protein